MHRESPDPGTKKGIPICLGMPFNHSGGGCRQAVGTQKHTPHMYPAKLPCPGRGPRRIYSYFYARKSKLIHPK